MSGVVGHTLYAILASRKTVERRLPVGGLIHRHFDSFLSGAYLGSDIQTLPEAVCVDTGKSVGYGTVALQQSPITGGPLLGAITSTAQLDPQLSDFVAGQQFRNQQIFLYQHKQLLVVFAYLILSTRRTKSCQSVDESDHQLATFFQLFFYPPKLHTMYDQQRHS
jgi:hypothetical protein